MRSLTWEEVRRLRMAKAHLSARTERPIAAIAGDLGGIHAQVMSAAETSLGIRAADWRVGDVRAALWTHRSIVKAWTLRGTLHLHPAEELPLWISARAAVTSGIHDRTLSVHGLDAKRADAITDAIADALDGKCLSRQELADAVSDRLGDWAHAPLMSGWGTMLGQATLRGWLCHGPPEGAKVTFVRADQWLGTWQEHDPQEALRWVAIKYIGQFGPVNHSSFHAWFNGPTFKVSDARKLFEGMADHIEPVEVAGRSMWILKGAAIDEPSLPPRVRLLPLYDCFLTGFRERENLLSEEAVAFARTHPKGKLEGPVAVPWILVDGMIAGTWTRKSSGSRSQISAQLFSHVPRNIELGLAEQAELLSGFWGKEVDLEVVMP